MKFDQLTIKSRLVNSSNDVFVKQKQKQMNEMIGLLRID